MSSFSDVDIAATPFEKTKQWKKGDEMLKIPNRECTDGLARFQGELGDKQLLLSDFKNFLKSTGIFVANLKHRWTSTVKRVY
ncbi:MAG: hypothetical protein H6629_15890 [Calditrichae bacterium]|nr:hypothetical protein [Calditrichia bacterium]